MRRRPLLLLFVIICHILGPFVSTFVLSIYFNLSLYSILSQLYQNLSLVSFTFFLVYMPFLGFILLRPRIPAFFIFVFSHAFLIFSHLGEYRELYLVGQYNYLYLLLFGDVINLLFVGIILSENVRVLFFDSSMRWWESSPRYPVSFECTVEDVKIGQKTNGKILNVSIGGALVAVSEAPGVGELIRIRFNADSDQVDLEAIVRHYYQEEFDYTGIEFKFNNEAERKQISDILESLKKNGIKPLYDRYGSSLLGIAQLWKKDFSYKKQKEEKL